MNRSFYLKTKVLLGFGLVLSAIVLTSVIAYNSYEQLSRSVQTLSRQDTRLQQIDSILYMVNRSENSLQEYTIEKTPAKLGKYDSLVSKIRLRVQLLKSASVLNNSELDSILSLINARLVSMDEFMEIREQRDDFRFYDEALKQLEEERLTQTKKTEAVRETKPSSPASEQEVKEPAEKKTENETPQEDAASEEAAQEEKEEKGWFKNIIDRIFKNKDSEEEQDTPEEEEPKVADQEVLPEKDTLPAIENKASNLSIDSVRQMLQKLKSEQAATEEYLNQQELEYLGNNARVMDQINELIADVKLKRQQEYAQQSQEARTMLQTSLSRLGIILVIALSSTFLFVYLIFADITKSDFLKQQLEKAKERAEQLTKVKEDFLANMSHEIRTPLTAILGFTGLLRHTRLDAKQKEYVSAVDSSSSHLLSLVNDILDFSKIEAGQLSFETETFDLMRLVEQVCKDMQIQAEKKDLQLIVETEGEDLCFVKGDAFRLKQVLYNLISNAIKFTEEGGVIVRSRLKPLDDKYINVQLEVIDSGIGIPEEKQHHIFDAFVQSDVSDTRKYGGTGLGLSISKRIIESQGGEIALESEVGEGTTFFVALPLLKSEQSELKNSAEDAGEKLSFPGLKLLAIDDDPLNTQLLSVMLEKLGVTCFTAQKGQEGLDILQSEAIDLVLTDLQMPEMPGEEVAAAVRKMGLDDVPVIAFTARVTEHKDFFEQKGFNGVLHKPFGERDVVEMLKQHAEQFAQTAADEVPKQVAEEETEVAAPPGDLYKLDNIRLFIGDDQEAMLGFLENFLKGLRDSIQKIELALPENDLQTIGYHAHRLFPNVSQLQVPELPALLRQIENTAKSGQSTNAMKDDVRQALYLCRQLESALSERQESLKARVS